MPPDDSGRRKGGAVQQGSTPLAPITGSVLMAVKIALDSFLAVARRSNLVTKDQLTSQKATPMVLVPTSRPIRRPAFGTWAAKSGAAAVIMGCV